MKNFNLIAASICVASCTNGYHRNMKLDNENKVSKEISDFDNEVITAYIDMEYNNDDDFDFPDPDLAVYELEGAKLLKKIHKINKTEGIGTISYNCGSFYYGGIGTKNKRDGYGALICKGGYIYIGNWKKGNLNGFSLMFPKKVLESPEYEFNSIYNLNLDSKETIYFGEVNNNYRLGEGFLCRNSQNAKQSIFSLLKNKNYSQESLKECFEQLKVDNQIYFEGKFDSSTKFQDSKNIVGRLLLPNGKIAGGGEWACSLFEDTCYEDYKLMYSLSINPESNETVFEMYELAFNEDDEDYENDINEEDSGKTRYIITKFENLELNNIDNMKYDEKSLKILLENLKSSHPYTIGKIFKE